MIEIGAVSSGTTNLTAGGIATSGTIDHSYSRSSAKNEAADASSSTMSFDDFVDMINPLEHIPVISSVYRAIAGETISPLSRIAGDTLYGGILGLASAGISAIGAIGDEVVAANNDGQSASGAVVAALFGSDDSQSTQLADASADTTATATAVAETSTQAVAQASALQTPATQSPILQIPTFSQAATVAAATAVTQTNENTPKDASTDTAVADSGSAATSGKGMPLDRSKPAYGGVLDTSMVASAQQNQALALAMSGKQDTLQAQRVLRNSRFATSGVMNSLGSSSASTPAAAQASPETQAAMQGLIQELQSMKGTNQYKSSTQSTPVPGSTVNLMN